MERTIESVTARLISNTKRKKRYDNLLEIADQIRWLEKKLGSLTQVANTLSLSKDQLYQFLSVEKLSPLVREMVRRRDIDLINVVHYIRKFDSKTQEIIAQEYVAGNITATDIRVLAPLGKKMDTLSINDLLTSIKKSRNLKAYVIFFSVDYSMNKPQLHNKFIQLIGEDNIISFDIFNNIGKLVLTKEGLRVVRARSRDEKITLKKYIERIIVDGS